MGRKPGARKLTRRQSVVRGQEHRAAEAAYTLKFRWLMRCVYCGMPADTRDHVFPVCRAVTLDLRRPGVRKALGQGLNTVPACRECNSVAGSHPFTSIRAKRDFIQEKLRKRLSADLLMPDWDEAEIAELSYSMRMHVRRGQRAQARASMRCNWPFIRTSI